MRILHIADVHLDRPFVRADRREGNRDRARLRQIFSDCLQLATERAVDAVTIGGDLWEDEHVSTDTRRYVSSALSDVGCPVLIISGNHDRLLPGGHYERTDWPENVVLFPESIPTEYRLSDELSIWGVSWTHEDPTGEFLHRRVPPDDGRAHLVLLHGTAISFSGALEDRSYCPFEPRRVEDAGFLLCLAGHIHGASHAGSVVYPGSPEPLGWGEMGRHCAAIVTVNGVEVDVELVDVNRHVYDEVSVDCRECEHGAEVGERIVASLGEHDGATRHVRVRLTGEIARDCVVDHEQLSDAHRERFAEFELLDETHPAYDLEALAGQPDATGHFVRAMGERIDAEHDPAERLALELALDSGLRALHGRVDIVRVG